MCSTLTSTPPPQWRAYAPARDEEIADVLLHQEVLAGVGNVFKSEVCFVTGINPFCRVRDLNERQLNALVETSQKLSPPTCLRTPATPS